MHKMADAGKAWQLDRGKLDNLLAAIQRRGYAVLAPTRRDGAIMWGEIGSSKELPWGLSDAQAPGSYALDAGHPGRCFEVTHGPQSLKSLTFSACERLMHIRNSEDGSLIFENRQAEARPTAVIGVRPCDLAALKIQERIFVEGEYADPYFKARREKLLLVAVNCTRAQPTCFCVSMGCGPTAESGFDLAMTELEDGFLIQAGSRTGEAIAAELDMEAAGEAELKQARQAVESCAGSQTRSINMERLPQGLYKAHNHPHWDDVASRCLSCTNCTMVCPTCFCHAIEEVPNLSRNESERTRIWDSCFTPEHGYIHGKNMRPTTRERYRMWLTHKLASWIDQFGSCGCVGCGRCITWCPVGIDLTAETAALLEKDE